MTRHWSQMTEKELREWLGDQRTDCNEKQEYIEHACQLLRSKKDLVHSEYEIPVINTSFYRRVKVMPN